MSLRTIAIAAVAATVSFTTVLPDSQAEAGHRDDAYVAGAVGFVGGLILGGALSEHRHGHGHYHGGSLPAAHVQSCFDRYRSYDVHTNTWTDLSYRTRVCYSPHLY